MMESQSTLPPVEWAKVLGHEPTAGFRLIWRTLPKLTLRELNFLKLDAIGIEQRNRVIIVEADR
mgnify:CR=1 FL=1